MRQTTRAEQFYKTLPKVIFFGLFSNTGISEQSDYQSTLTGLFPCKVPNALYKGHDQL